MFEEAGEDGQAADYDADCYLCETRRVKGRFVSRVQMGGGVDKWVVFCVRYESDSVDVELVDGSIGRDVGELELVDEAEEAGDAGEESDGEDAGFLVPGHLETPDDGKREDEDGKVGDDVHDARGNAQVMPTDFDWRFRSQFIAYLMGYLGVLKYYCPRVENP